MKTVVEYERDSLRGMTMSRRIQVGPLTYEFDRVDGRRRLTVGAER